MITSRIQANRFANYRRKSRGQGRTVANRIRDKTSQEQYQKQACKRERIRLRNMNNYYQLLRARLPYSQKPSGKSLSKIQLLRRV